MYRALLIVLLMIIGSFSLVAQDAPPANLTDECVSEYDTESDYFPEEAEITNAENFSVEYGNNYKLVSVTGAAETYTYLLVQCGTPAPDDLDLPEDTPMIEIPVAETITLSTTQVVHLAELGVLDTLAGLDSFLYINNPDVRDLIEADELIEVAPNFELNTELVLEAEPDIVISDDFDPSRLETLADLGITVAVNTDYLEATPLGRAEWVKYAALFYNEEAAAAEIYAEIVTEYEAAQELAASVPEDDRPTVLWNTFFSDAWGIPGPQTYAGNLILDAGGEITLVDETDGGTAFLSFETVYEGALDADIWVVNLFAVEGIPDVIAMDERYADFEAVQEGQVWNNDLDVNENGGSNYFELGVTNPHLILQDLVAIFHPELLPDHEFNFYRQLPPGDE